MAHNVSDEISRNADATRTDPTEDLKARADRTVEEARRVARELAERGSEIAGDALDSGRDYVEQARVQAGRVYEVGQQKAQEAAFYAELGYEEVADMVRRRPVQAVGLAVGVGILIGLVLARR